jgi:hypothetical protein
MRALLPANTRTHAHVVTAQGQLGAQQAGTRPFAALPFPKQCALYWVGHSEPFDHATIESADGALRAIEALVRQPDIPHIQRCHRQHMTHKLATYAAVLHDIATCNLSTRHRRCNVYVCSCVRWRVHDVPQCMRCCAV